MNERTADEKIADAQRIESFLQDEAVRNAVIEVEQVFIEELIAAKTSEERARAQGKVVALRALMGEIRAVMDRGEHELIQVAVKAKQQEILKARGLLH